MASQYKFQDAVNIVGRQINRVIEDEHAASICNLAQNLIWMSYDWRETIALLPPFYLIPDEQDHGAPAVSVPADFYGLRLVHLIILNAEPPPRFDLSVVQDLRLTHKRQMPHAICFDRSTRKFRVYPRVPPQAAASMYMIDGTYKKRPAKITAAALPSLALPFDDIYFDVWVETMKWAAWQTSGDPRAGGVVMASGGQKQYTGQFALAIERISAMAAAEGIELGAPALAPREPLVGMPYGAGLMSPNTLLLS